MLSYATIGAADLESAIKFYDAVLSPLGASRFYTGEGSAGYMVGQGPQMLWICLPYDKEPAKAGNGIMIGFTAPTRAAVDAFHEAALANGGTCEGKPGLREAYGPNMYLAYVRDTVGNKMSALCAMPE